MEPSSPAGPLSALSALQLTPATSQIALDLLSHLVPSHSLAPNSPLFEGDDEPSSPAGPLHAL